MRPSGGDTGREIIDESAATEESGEGAAPALPISEIRVIGSIDVIDAEGRPIPVPPTLRHLLAILVAVGPGGIESDRLADDLWGERLPPSWKASLRMAVSRLRSRIGPESIDVGGGRVRLSVARVDLWELRRLAVDGPGTTTDTGLAALLVAPSLFVGVEPTPLLEQAEMRAVGQQRDLIRRIADGAQTVGAEVMGALDGYCRAAPLDEGTAIAVARLHGAAGRWDAAASVLDRTIAERRRHLGVGPSPTARSLRDEISGGDDPHRVWLRATGRAATILWLRAPGADRAATVDALMERIDSIVCRTTVRAGDPPLGPIVRLLPRAAQAVERILDERADGRDARAALWSALDRSLDHVLSTGPTTLVVEDAHRLDSASTGYLRHVVRDRPDRRLDLVLVTDGTPPPLAPTHTSSAPNHEAALGALSLEPGPSTDVVATIAVVGPIDVDDLAVVAGRPLEEIHPAVDLLAAAGHASDTGAGWAVTDDSLREEFAATIPADRQRHLHERAATVTEHTRRLHHLVAAGAAAGPDVAADAAAAIARCHLAAGGATEAAAILDDLPIDLRTLVVRLLRARCAVALGDRTDAGRRVDAIVDDLLAEPTHAWNDPRPVWDLVDTLDDLVGHRPGRRVELLGHAVDAVLIDAEGRPALLEAVARVAVAHGESWRLDNLADVREAPSVRAVLAVVDHPGERPALDEPPHRRPPLEVELRRRLELGHTDAAAALARDLVRDGPDRPDLARLGHLALACCAAIAGRIDDARHHRRSARDLPLADGRSASVGDHRPLQTTGTAGPLPSLGLQVLLGDPATPELLRRAVESVVRGWQGRPAVPDQVADDLLRRLDPARAAADDHAAAAILLHADGMGADRRRRLAAHLVDRRGTALVTGPSLVWLGQVDDLLAT